MPLPRSMPLHHALVCGAAMVGAAAACASEERAAPPRYAAVGVSYADRGSGARKVGVIEGFYGPESVKYDAAQDVYFVSNMLGPGSDKDGAGYIVRVDASDITKADVFAQGGKDGVTLNAPKGMALHGDTLWVTDIDVLRGFDRRSGALLATLDLSAHNAVLLNDVAVGPDGALRVTDTGIIMSPKGVMYPGGDKIFVIGPNQSVSVLVEGKALARPNGITWDATGKRWVLVNFDPFQSEVSTMRQGDTARSVIAKGKGKFDGVEALADGRVLVTGWNDSSVHVVEGGKAARIIGGLVNPADLGVDTRRGRIAVPLPTMDRVEIWELPAR